MQSYVVDLRNVLNLILLEVLFSVSLSPPALSIYLEVCVARQVWAAGQPVVRHCTRVAFPALANWDRRCASLSMCTKSASLELSQSDPTTRWRDFSQEGFD